MRHIKIGVRLVVGFLAVSGITLALGLLAIHAVSVFNEDVRDIGVIALPLTENLGAIQSNMNKIGMIQRTLLDRDTPQEVRQRAASVMHPVEEQYRAELAAIEALPLSEADRAGFGGLKAQLTQWLAANDQFLSASETSDFAKMSEIALRSGRDQRLKAEKALETMIADQSRQSKERVAGAARRNESLKTTAVSLVCVGVLASLAIGVGISRGITVPLRRCVNAATAMAKGQPDQTFQTDRKDELGELARSLSQVSGQLGTILTAYDAMVAKIETGDLLGRASTETLEGEFAALVQSGNKVADIFVEHLNQLPVPVMTVASDFTVLFLNTTGQELVGSNTRGRKCSEIFQTDDCRTERCACAQAMRLGQKAHSQTEARPGGRRLDIAYSGSPIRDRRGVVVGALEIVVDQTEILSARRKMLRVAEQASQVASRVASASEELSAQIEQSSGGAELQNRRVSETAMSMEQMNTTVLEVAQNASQAATSAEKARYKAEEGASVVDGVVKGIRHVQTQSLALKENMSSLGAQAEGIGEIMNVISDIADQTNLLALNAAIEAARAGEAGRGFAVVADEVRKLAEKTMTATKEVGQAIQGIQQGTRSNVENVERAVATIEQATAEAGKSGETLAEIVSLVDLATAEVTAIATASEEQSAASEEISRSIEDVSRVSNETMDAMQQSALAVGELASQAQVLKDLIEELQGGSSTPALT